MGVSSCSTGSTEPLDSDGLVAHNDQVQQKRYTNGFSTDKVTQCILHSQHNTVISSRHYNLENTCSAQHPGPETHGGDLLPPPGRGDLPQEGPRHVQAGAHTGKHLPSLPPSTCPPLLPAPCPPMTPCPRPVYSLPSWWGAPRRVESTNSEVSTVIVTVTVAVIRLS